MFRTRIVFVCIVIFTIKVGAQTSILNAADSLYVQGNYTKAIAHYKLYENPQEVSYKIAQAYQAIGNYQEALNYYKKSIQYNPDNQLVKYDYAKSLYKTKRFNEASVLYKALIETDKTNPNYYYHLGLSLEQLRDSTAIHFYKKTFQIDTTHQKTTFKIAKYMLKKRKHDSVDYYVDIGLKSYDTNVELISIQAQSYYWQEYYRKSRMWFEKLVDLNESSQFIHEKLSQCYAKTYEYKKAIEHCIIALNYEPQNTTNIYLLGHMYHQIEDFKNAEKFIKMAIELQDIPLDSEYTKLATILNRQKKHNEALAALNIAIKENPKNESAHFFIALTKDKFYKDIDSRVEAYEKFKEQFPKSPYSFMADKRISELKTEKFRQVED